MTSKAKKKLAPERRRKARDYRQGYEAGRRSAEAEYAPEHREQSSELAGSIRALEEILPHANWNIAKGRVEDGEQLFAVVIFDGLTAIGAAEGSNSLADVVRQATETAIFGTWTDSLSDEPVPQNIIQQIALAAANIGNGAGEPAMEIAGQIVSALAANPELTSDFLKRGADLFFEGKLSVDRGCLPYRALNGSIVTPSELRKQMGAMQ